jgi:hypothetical protein
MKLRIVLAAIAAAAIAVPTVVSAQTTTGTSGQTTGTSAQPAGTSQATGTDATGMNGMKKNSAHVRSSRAEMRTHPVKKHVIIKKHTPSSASSS